MASLTEQLERSLTRISLVMLVDTMGKIVDSYLFINAKRSFSAERLSVYSCKTCVAIIIYITVVRWF